MTDLSVSIRCCNHKTDAQRVEYKLACTAIAYSSPAIPARSCSNSFLSLLCRVDRLCRTRLANSKSKSNHLRR
ncbi:hypothetical protein BC827DRAFT_830766 [Russula dissimulans]|nr:hypothetical protein BC827DRAFT_830766 [Russula dissimulans]